jgi:hypothetical protein
MNENKKKTSTHQNTKILTILRGISMAGLGGLLTEHNYCNFECFLRFLFGPMKPK